MSQNFAEMDDSTHKDQQPGKKHSSKANKVQKGLVNLITDVFEGQESS